MPKSYCILLTNGPSDSLKTEIGIVCGFGLLKNGHDVQFAVMGEGGWLADWDVLNACNGFGLPPMKAILAKKEMKGIKWTF